LERGLRHSIAKLSEKPVDIGEFCSRLLPVYIGEAEAIGLDPAGALLASIAASGDECYGGWVGGTPVAIFGAALYPNSPGANLWVIQARGYERALVGFMRQTKRITDEWAEKYGHVYGHVRADNRRMVRFCLWCGFEAVPADRGGVLYAEVHKQTALTRFLKGGA
jgi:hypothetical protein